MTVPWPSLSPDDSVVPALPSDEASSGALFLLSSQQDGLWWKEASGFPGESRLQHVYVTAHSSG